MDLTTNATSINISNKFRIIISCLYYLLNANYKQRQSSLYRFKYTHPLKSKFSATYKSGLIRIFFNYIKFSAQYKFRIKISHMEFLSISRKMLCTIGYPNEFRQHDHRPSWYWKAYANSCWLLLAFVSIPEFHFFIVNLSNIQMATEALCTLLTCFLSLSKLLTIHMGKKQIFRLTFNLKSMWNAS